MTQNQLEISNSHKGGYHQDHNSNRGTQKIEINPKLPGFFFMYVLFGLPGFIGSLLWTFFVFFLVIGLIVGLVSPTDTNQLPLDYRVVQSSNLTDDAILIYDLTGQILTGDSTVTDFSRTNTIYTELVRRDFARIKEDDSIKNVVFRVNTPGGSVFASQVLGDQINDLIVSKGQQEVVFFFDQIVASGGLWAAYKTSNYVVGSPYGQTGSIGVILSLPNFQGLADKVGYSETIIKSSNSKDVGNPLRPVTEEEQTFLQSQVDETYNEFVEVVAEGRDITRDEVLDIANGFVYDNDEALEFGLINELGKVESAIKRAADNAGISDYNVYEVRTEAGFGSLLASSWFPALDSLNKAAESLDATNDLEPGVVYAIDITRIE